ncbi:uncharacterized protein LOC144493182 [Mustelus asterias]
MAIRLAAVRKRARGAAPSFPLPRTRDLALTPPSRELILPLIGPQKRLRPRSGARPAVALIQRASGSPERPSRHGLDPETPLCVEAGMCKEDIALKIGEQASNVKIAVLHRIWSELCKSAYSAGQTIFSCFINNLPSKINSEIGMFADDCTGMTVSNTRGSNNIQYIELTFNSIIITEFPPTSVSWQLPLTRN